TSRPAAPPRSTARPPPNPTGSPPSGQTSEYRYTLANPQGQEEIHLVIERGQITPGQLLDPADPVTHGIDVHVHPRRAGVPRPRAGQELPQRRQQFGLVLLVIGEQRTEQALAERYHN